uniref:BED-type domain-containing protein n=2 Tax=Davidia involucrata TaxID=16924 RepID=A0A5B6YZU5_DAVIN
MSEQGESQARFTQPSTPASFSPPSSASTEVSPKKRKLTSDVWNDFKKIKTDGQDYAVCNICNLKLKATSENGTKTLYEHLGRCKKQRSMDARQQHFQANQRRNDGQVEYRTLVFDQEASCHELASMIILHDYPLSIVNHIGFQRFLSSLQPMFKMVSQKTIKSNILKIYDSEKGKTSELLEKLESRVAITFEIWTSNQTKKGFMAVTAHFIDEAWILQSRILRFVYVPAPHNEEVLSNFLIDCLFDLNIDRKLSAITMDYCTTNDAIIDCLLDKLDTNSLLLEGRVLHMRCCAHFLNLIVKDGLEVIGDGIERIRDSILFWTATPDRIENFEEAVQQLKISYTKKLCLDCKTRWESTYDMLQTAIMYKDVFLQLKQHERLYTRLPTEKDWDLATEICGRLKLFYNLTELYPRTLYPTANCYFPKVCEIRLALSQWLQSPIEIIRMMASKMMEKYEKYWDVCHVVMGIAVVLDPQYKMKLVEYYFSIIYGDGARAEIEKVRQHCYDVLHEYQSKLRLNETSNCGASSSSSSCYSGATNSKEHDLFSKFDLFVKMSSSNIVKSELDYYLEENVLPRTLDFDVLGWWKTNGVKFPTLQRIARDIFAIPVSSVASKSTFSNGGRLVSPHRSRLQPVTLEALMCAQSWLWNEINATCSTSYQCCASRVCDEDDDCDDVLEAR